LAGELACARLLVLPRSVDSWQRLYYYLCELGRSFGARVPPPFLYDVLHGPFATSAAYSAHSTQLLADALAAVSGRRPEHAALAESIALYNRIRDQLARVSALRRAEPCRFAGADALDLYSAAQRLDRSVFDNALGALLAREHAAHGGIRTLLVGSAHDTPALYQIVARAGGQVVADFHWRGELLFGPPIREDIAPMTALSEHYQRHSISVRTLPPPTAAVVELAQGEPRASGAVLLLHRRGSAELGLSGTSGRIARAGAARARARARSASTQRRAAAALAAVLRHVARSSIVEGRFA
jgi:2-hydroxyglutaryl-CoA dehydratase, D-component